MNSFEEALGMVFAMGAVILFCRAFPFIFFRAKEGEGGSSLKDAALLFIEKIVPPAAMTVLAFNSLGGAFREDLRGGLLVLAASVFTALVHIWKRNALLSIIGGTVVYMVLSRL